MLELTSKEMSVDGCLYFWFLSSDVNECISSDTTPCVPTAHCRNKIPGFECICPFGNTGDGTRSGSGCKNYFQVLEAAIGGYTI